MAQTSLQQVLNLFNGEPDPTPDYSNYNQSDFDNSFKFTSSGAKDDSTPLNNTALSYGPHDLSTYAPGLVTPVASALTANPHGGEDKIGNYSTGTYTPTAAQINNQANTDKYPLNDYSADDRFRTDGGMQPNRGLTPTTTSPNPGGGGGGGGGGYSGPAPIPQVLISQNLSQRTPSGSIYAPDLSAYNDSSLFNYTGPGGLDEYTYGQNLPYQGAGYDIWGSPTDVANPYYEGQYAPLPTPVVTQPEPVGPADGAIGMSPVVMPPGIPPVSVQPPSSTNQPSMPGFTGGGGTGTGEKDLNYFETLAAMGIDPADAPSTTFPSPGETIADKDYQDMLDKALTNSYSGMDEQQNYEIDSSKPSQIMMDEQQNYEIDPYKGEAELNKDVVKTQLPNQDFLSDDMDLSFDPNLDFDSSKDPNNLDSNYQYRDYLARLIGDGMAKNQAELMAKGQFLQDKYDAQEAIQKKDNLFNQHFDRNQAEYTPTLSDYYPDATPMKLAGSSSTLSGEKLNTRHPAYQASLDRIANESENIFQNQDVDADDYQRALDKERYQTQINHPTADFSGHMKNYGLQFDDQAKLSDVSSATPMQLHKGEPLGAIKDGPKEGPSGLTANDLGVFDYSADDRFRQTPQSIADVNYDARPLNRAHNASQMEVANTNIFNEKRDNSIFAKGPSETSTEIKSVFDEQQNYEVPASEMSPGETGLINGIVEGIETLYGGDAFSVDGSGTDRNVTATESAAWDKYYDYKNAGIQALNKGDIDIKAFNELKGKAGSDTVIDHFVDTDNHPKINNFVSNTANLFYQAMDVIVGDDTIKEGITDYYQQGKGVNSDKPLGTIGEEIAKAKKATQQRKEAHENIFTPGPMKFAAVASEPKPVVVKKSKPVRIPVVTKKATPKKTVKTGPSGKTTKTTKKAGTIKYNWTPNYSSGRW